jgi:ATP-dependent helicase/nuclease subunit A
MANVVLFQAGAGSGKTYSICDEIGKRIKKGQKPSQLLATTFTRKAAAELKTRIQKSILEDPTTPMQERVTLAEDLDRALVGTVHSVGYQLLQRYSYRLGLGAKMEPLEEKAEEQHLRRLLAELPPEPWRQLSVVARRLGQSDVAQLALDLLEQKRANSIDDARFQEDLVAGGERLLQITAPGGTDATCPSFAEFRAECAQTLAALERVTDESDKSSKVRDALREVANASRQEWKDWASVAALEAARASAPTLEPLKATARRVRLHPNLHADLRAFLKGLAERVVALEAAYRSYKSQRGLVDFTDLEERLLGLLDNTEVRRDLAAAIDLVVVDEFQDTNPIQLAIFQRFAELAKECLWVGDEKQAIYGFRGSDALLMQTVMDTVAPENRRRLDTSWRSRKGLVEFANGVFVPIFGGDAALKARPSTPGEFPNPGTVERWVLRGGNKDQQQLALVRGIKELHAEGVALGKIAILVRKNDEARGLGGHLTKHGIPVVVEVPGLLSTREGMAASAGIRLVADWEDSLAAATLLHILGDASEETPSWLIKQLEVQAAADDDVSWKGHPVLDQLREIPARGMAPSAVVAQVVQILRLPEQDAKWGDVARRNTNLDALLALGQTYEEQTAQEGKAPTLTGLVAWMNALQRDEADFLPLPVGLDAVTVMTIHKAKGLEWPTVILLLQGQERGADPWRIHVSGGKAQEGQPLQDRTLRFWPFPFGSTGFGGRSKDGTGLHDAVMATPEGAAVQKAMDDETLRVLYVAFTRAKDYLVLAHGPKGHPWLSMLTELDRLAPVDASTSPATAPGTSAAYARRDLAPELPPEDVTLAAPTGEVIWLKDAPTAAFATVAPRASSPSKATATGQVVITTEPVPGPHKFPTVKTELRDALGDAIHTYLGGLPAMRSMSSDAKTDAASDCLTRWTMGGVVNPDDLVSAGQRLEEWVESRYPGSTWLTEVPVNAPRAAGGQWVGSIDLLLLTPSGNAVIVDHKSWQGEPGRLAAKAQEFAPQIAAYVEALEACGTTVEAGWLHFPLAGMMAGVGLAARRR